MKKVCTECKIEKPLDKYNLAKKGKFGRYAKCKDCRRNYNIKNKEIRSIKNKKRYQKEKIKARVRKYKENNKDKVNQNKRKWLQKDREKNPEKYRIKAKKWNDKNKALKNSYTANRRATKKKATIDLNSNCKIVLKQYYKVAKVTNKQVDHIIPLQNDDVCGLHVPWNLQVISKSENIKKSNKFDGTYNNKGWLNE